MAVVRSLASLPLPAFHARKSLPRLSQLPVGSGLLHVLQQKAQLAGVPDAPGAEIEDAEIAQHGLVAGEMRRGPGKPKMGLYADQLVGAYEKAKETVEKK